MAKISTLQAALSNQTGKAKPATLAPPSDQVAVARPKPPVGPGRIGQVNVSAYLPKGYQDSLRLLYAQSGRPQRELIAEALKTCSRNMTCHRFGKTDRLRASPSRSFSSIHIIA